MALAVIASGLIRDFGRARKAPETQRRQLLAKSRTADSIPYAPAIAAGVWLSLVGAEER